MIFSDTGNQALATDLLNLARAEQGSPATRSRKGSDGSGSNSTRRSGKQNRALVTYLNVHAGVSVGVMAGMDVGAKDRFEVAKT